MSKGPNLELAEAGRRLDPPVYCVDCTVTETVSVRGPPPAAPHLTSYHQRDGGLAGLWSSAGPEVRLGLAARPITQKSQHEEEAKAEEKSRSAGETIDCITGIPCVKSTSAKLTCSWTCTPCRRRWRGAERSGRRCIRTVRTRGAICFRNASAARDAHIQESGGCAAEAAVSRFSGLRVSGCTCLPRYFRTVAYPT